MATRIKEKAAQRKANRDKRPRAVANHIRISPRKAKIVVDLIRGKRVEDALAILMFTPKSASPVLIKLLNSAIANAENNLEMDRESLYIAEAYANQGPTLKRYWARSHGRADVIKKRTSHLTIVLDKAK
jgi:large subunit ribosomal protein L22